MRAFVFWWFLFVFTSLESFARPELRFPRFRSILADLALFIMSSSTDSSLLWQLISPLSLSPPSESRDLKDPKEAKLYPSYLLSSVGSLSRSLIMFLVETALVLLFLKESTDQTSLCSLLIYEYWCPKIGKFSLSFSYSM